MLILSEVLFTSDRIRFSGIDYQSDDCVFMKSVMSFTSWLT